MLNYFENEMTMRAQKELSNRPKNVCAGRVAAAPSARPARIARMKASVGDYLIAAGYRLRAQYEAATAQGVMPGEALVFSRDAQS